MPEWLPVIINPAARRQAAILSTLNQVFIEAGVRWSVEITIAEGDARRIAHRLAQEGATQVAVMGGDGTISEAAAGLAGTQTALGILPGGTGNVLAFEFEIPRNLVEAARLVAGPHRVRTVDMGEIETPGEQRKFLLRAGAGLEALVVRRAPRHLKDRFGLFAYGLAGLQALVETRPVNYHLELDGMPVDLEGILCTVANAGHLGVLPNLSMKPTVSLEDGLLDVMVMSRVDLENMIALLSGRLSPAEAPTSLHHWQVRRATIASDPPQNTQVDGDSLGTTPLRVCSLPGVLHVIAPEKA